MKTNAADNNNNYNHESNAGGLAIPQESEQWHK